MTVRALSSTTEAVIVANVNHVVAFATHYPVFPCRRTDKSPHTVHGFKEATQSEQQIRAWWARWPDALVGVPTGEASKLVLVDYDQYKQDALSDAWIADHIDLLLSARIHTTRRGGKHYFFRSIEKRFKSLNGAALAGVKRSAIDIKADGGYAIWWPFHGGSIVQGEGEEAPDLPSGLIDELEMRPEVAQQRFQERAPVEWARERNTVVSALGYVDPGGRQEWLDVGMALHDASGASEAGFQLWHAWASGALTGNCPAGYEGERDCRYAWEHFRSDREKVVRIGTIYAMAAEAGWVRPPPPKKNGGAEKPDVSVLSARSLGEIMEVKTEGREWFFHELLPAGAFLIVGRPKVGKSWLLLQLALCVGGGSDFLGYEIRYSPEVLYIAAEDDESRIQSRFQTFRIAETPAQVRVIVRDELARWAQDFGKHYTLAEFIDAYLTSHQKTKFVILDTETTCRQMWEGSRPDREKSVVRKDYQEVREFDSVALRHSAFIGLVNHTGKRKGSGTWLDIHELINRTNTALAGASGSIVLADPPDHDPLDNKSKLRVLGVRGRDIKDDILLALEQDEFAVFHNKGPFSAHQQTQAETSILEALERMHGDGGQAESWFTAKQIGEDMGIKAGTVQRTISRMMRAKKNDWKTFRIETKQKKGIRLVAKTVSADE